MRINKKSIVAILLGFTTIISFGSVLSSTLAWFAYTTSVITQMKGTAVSETQQLQVGLKTPISVFSAELIDEYSLSEFIKDGETYTFAAPGRGFDSVLLNHYLTQVGYASNSLSPVTSKKYETGDSFTLYSAPSARYPDIVTPANKEDYVRIPFAFRILQVDIEGLDTYSPNQPLYITEASVKADNGVGDVYKSVRVHFDGCKFNSDEEVVTNKFIFNPSASSSSFNKVAGLLNLDGDDYFDTYSYIGSEEVIYGDYDLIEEEQAAFITEDTNFDDINGTGNSTMKTTFTAKHQSEHYIYSSLDFISPHKAHYLSLNDIKPTEINGLFTGGEVITVTSDDEYGIADLVATVYIEGWDHSVIDQEIDHGFYLGLTFEINRTV